MATSGHIEETTTAGIVDAIAAAERFSDFVLEVQGWNPTHFMKVADTKVEYAHWLGSGFGLQSDYAVTFIGVDTDDILAYAIPSRDFITLSSYTNSDYYSSRATRTYLITKEGSIYSFPTTVGKNGLRITITIDGTLKSIQKFTGKETEPTIITARRYDLWWKRAKGWFSNQFSNIINQVVSQVVAALPAEATEEEIDAIFE